MASGSVDNTVRIWDLDSGSCDLVLEGHNGVRVPGICANFVYTHADNKESSNDIHVL